MLLSIDLVDNVECCGVLGSLKFMNVAMVTILKNVTNLITACGEIYFFNKHHSSKVWGSLGLMVCLQSSFYFIITAFAIKFCRQRSDWKLTGRYCFGFDGFVE